MKPAEESSKRSTRQPPSREPSAVLEALLKVVESALAEDAELPSVRSLSRKAGVAIGALYYYARQREDLVLMVLRRENARVVDRMLRVLSGTKLSTPSADIAAMMGELAAWRSERAFISRLPFRYALGRNWAKLVIQSAVPAGAEILQEIGRRHQLRELTPTENLHLVGAVLGHQIGWALEVEGSEAFDVVTTMVGGYLDGIAR